MTDRVERAIQEGEMRVLSIDLPWSADDGCYGLAWVDDIRAPGAVLTRMERGGPQDALTVLSRHRGEHGRFDIILIDQPLGGLSCAGYRDVERAFGNSAFVPVGNRRLQCPRFQPGGPHAASGERLAMLASNALGAEDVRVVESFPQLSLAPLLFFAETAGLDVSGVTNLRAHKGGSMRLGPQQQLLRAFTSWTGRDVEGDAAEGSADAVDAVLAVLPIHEVFSPSPRDEPWAQPVWLHAAPGGAPLLPALVPRGRRRAQRGYWMAPLQRGACGGPGIRTDGLVALSLPEWGAARQAERPL